MEPFNHLSEQDFFSSVVKSFNFRGISRYSIKKRLVFLRSVIGRLQSFCRFQLVGRLEISQELVERRISTQELVEPSNQHSRVC